MIRSYESKDYSNSDNVEYAFNNAIADGICAVTLLEKHVNPSELNNTLTGHATLAQFSSFAKQFTKIEEDTPICLKKAYAAASTFKKMAALWDDPAGFDLAKRAEVKFLTALDDFLEKQTSFNHRYVTLSELFDHESFGLGVGSFKQEVAAMHEQRNYLYRVDTKRDFSKIKDSTFRAARWVDTQDFPHKLLKNVFSSVGPGNGLYRICFCMDELSANNVLSGDAAALAKRQGQSDGQENRMIRCPRQAVLDCGFTENIDQEYSVPGKINARMYYKSEALSATNQSFSDSGIPFSAFEIFINGSWQSLQAWIQAQNAAAIAQQQQQQPTHNNNHPKSGSLLQKIATALGLSR